MSFMFHPYPYSDPQAVNDVSGQGVSPVRGLHAVTRSISALLREGKRVGLDVYPGADYLSLVNVVRNLCAEEAVDFIDASGLLKSPEYIDALTLPYLPEDRTADPVLPCAATQAIIEAARAAGNDQARFTPVPGATHDDVWQLAAQTAGLGDWLFAQRNAAFGVERAF